MLRLVSHCHTHHSFDSSLSVECIIEEANKFGVNAIIINDHDIYSISDEELMLFSDNGIVIFKAIEFTTKEGVHVIGIDDSIHLLEKSPYYYTLIELLNKLIILDAKIVFPHPYHATGVYGNSNVDLDMFYKAVNYAHGFEVDNFRYGPTPKFLINKILESNSRAIQLIGSDAHKMSEVGAFINIYTDIEESECFSNYSVIFSTQPDYLVLKKRSNFYFKFKTFQKSKFYQRFIGLIDYKQRQTIKKLFKFGK